MNYEKDFIINNEIIILILRGIHNSIEKDLLIMVNDFVTVRKLGLNISMIDKEAMEYGVHIEISREG